jgi:hypothetical protein
MEVHSLRRAIVHGRAKDLDCVEECHQQLVGDDILRHSLGRIVRGINQLVDEVAFEY